MSELKLRPPKVNFLHLHLGRIMASAEVADFMAADLREAAGFMAVG